jgi:acyl-coenzyme A thioesterase PaaI-like protein
MNPLDMSGLDLLRAAVAGTFPPSSMALTIPMAFAAVDPGYVRVRASADERHLNPLGGVHGGFAASVLDSVTGCAVHVSRNIATSEGTLKTQDGKLLATATATCFLKRA